MGERAGLGAAKQGRVEKRERLGGEAQPLGTGKSELEPEDQHVCAIAPPAPKAPSHWLAAPLSVQAKY